MFICTFFSVDFFFNLIHFIRYQIQIVFNFFAREIRKRREEKTMKANWWSIFIYCRVYERQMCTAGHTNKSFFYIFHDHHFLAAPLLLLREYALTKFEWKDWAFDRINIKVSGRIDGHHFFGSIFKRKMLLTRRSPNSI